MMRDVVVGQDGCGRGEEAVRAGRVARAGAAKRRGEESSRATLLASPELLLADSSTAPQTRFAMASADSSKRTHSLRVTTIEQVLAGDAPRRKIVGYVALNVATLVSTSWCALRSQQALCLKCGSGVADAVVVRLAERFSALTSIDLSGSYEKLSIITDAALTAVAAHCPNLTSIDLRFCCNITDAAVTIIKKHLPNLHFIKK